MVIHDLLSWKYRTQPVTVSELVTRQAEGLAFEVRTEIAPGQPTGFLEVFFPQHGELGLIAESEAKVFLS